MTRREKLQQLLLDNPNDVFLLYGWAMEERSAQHWEEALNAFDQVLAVDSNYVAAYFQKAQVLAQLGRSAEARQVLEAGITVGRDVGDAHAVGEMTEFLQSL